MQIELNDYSDERLLEIAESSKSFHDFLKKLGKTTNGGSDYIYYRSYFKSRGLNLSFKGANNTYKMELGDDNKFKQKYADNEVFTKHSKVYRKSVKYRILRNKLIDYICAKCGNTGEWQGKQLNLQLEHKNGVNTDNRLENLEFLCPNCHSQTDTFGSKNSNYRNVCVCGEFKHRKSKICVKCENNRRKNNKKKLPELQILIEDIKAMGFVKTGQKYNVSDNAVRKWIKSYGVDPKTIKQQCLLV